MASLVERLMAEDEDSKVLDDKDILQLQVAVIESLRKDLAFLEDENRQLRALNQEQTIGRVKFLKEVIMHRGVELKAHGDFLIRIARGELSTEDRNALEQTSDVI